MFNARDFKKYGFVRTPEHDFSDDGNRFATYKYKNRIQISYLNDTLRTGNIYISADFDEIPLNFDEVHTLPSYSKLYIYNGVKPEEIDLPEYVKILDKFLAEADKKIEEVEDIDLDLYEEYLTYMKDYDEDCLSLALAAIKLDKLFDLREYYYTNVRKYVQSLKSKVKEWEDTPIKDRLTIKPEQEPYVRQYIKDYLESRQKGRLKKPEDNFYVKEIQTYMNS